MTEPREAVVPLPEGTRLLHIGPHKTGTTTVQAGFHQNRETLERFGVHYAGPNSQPMPAAMAAARGSDLPGASSGTGLRRWHELLEEVRAAQAPRTVISSEFFCDAPADRVRAIVEDLDPTRLHVVVTVRPLVRILASQWQQYMQNGPPMGYDAALDFESWLTAILDPSPPSDLTPSFWRRHRQDEVVRRWADVVGTDRLTVIAVDDRDPGMLTTVFEELLALPAGALTPHDLGANRSLTVPEIELLRRVNAGWTERGWSAADYTRMVRFGAVRYLQQRMPDEGEDRLLTPDWAVERAAAIGAAAAERISGSGVRVIGDLAVLGDPGVARGVGSSPAPEQVSTEVAVRLVAGVIRALAGVPGRPAPEDRDAGPIELAVRADKRGRRAVENLERNQERVRRSRAALEPPTVEDASVLRIARSLAGTVRRRLRPPRSATAAPTPVAQPVPSPQRPSRQLDPRAAYLEEAVGGGRALALVGVGADDAALAERLRDRAETDGGRVVVAERDGDDPARHVRLTAEGPFDVVVDLGPGEDRRATFLDCFYHLTLGGEYLVPGRVNLDRPAEDTLGHLLVAASRVAKPSRVLDCHKIPEDRREAIGLASALASVEQAGPVLRAVRGDRPVPAKMRETEMNELIALRPEWGHRLIRETATEPFLPQVVYRRGREVGETEQPRPLVLPSRSLREYRDVLVANRQVVTDGRVLTPDTYRHNAKRRLTNRWTDDLAPRFAGLRLDLPAAQPLPGTYFHLDSEFRGHFGHLMTEQIARFWAWPEVRDLYPDAKVLVTGNNRRPEMLDYEYAIFAAGGIEPEDVVLVEEPVEVERLLAATPLFSNPNYVDPVIAATWRGVGDRLAAQVAPRARPARIFCSRRHDKRSCLNADVVEREFVERGFEIIFPEDYPLGEQVALFRAAEVVAGFAGSAMFTLSFAEQPRPVILVGADSYTPRNEYLIAAVHGHTVDLVVCESLPPHGLQSPFVFDPDREGHYLRAVLDGLD